MPMELLISSLQLVIIECLGLVFWTSFIMALINPEWYSNQVLCTILSMALIVSLYDFVQFERFYLQPQNNENNYREWYLALVRMDKFVGGIGLVGVEHLILNLLGWTRPAIITSAFLFIVCGSKMVGPELVWLLRNPSPVVPHARNDRRF
ncbi:hypothetical protein BGX26_000420 [Mortierella sp. AD094]|nr:hypothetical protein BGX26_000420 [Mortierella sp. AD094]